MRIEIAEHGRMSESGSSLLRLIQNQDMPLLDLLVREAIQNSLDAAIPNKKSVDVEFISGNFCAYELNSNLEGVTDALNNLFPSKSKKYRYIMVRDKNTQGLTGPTRYEDVRNNEFGNLLKLVYEICKPQRNEGAGGSWGLGKTVYFRLGIGLVLYYSRIQHDGKFISRLAACLVEDERKEDSIIPCRGGLKRGIAWWGDDDGANKTVPIEDEVAIEKILSVFDIVPYNGNETGTTVIIPYVDEENLLAEVYTRNDELEQKPYWVNTLDDYISISIQRWYAPRILNHQFKNGPYLDAKVNGKKLCVSKMLPLFRIVRELYILAIEGDLDSNSFIKEVEVEYIVERVMLRNVFVENPQKAGGLAFLRISKQQLKMEAPDNNKSPYQQICNREGSAEGGNAPIITYTRCPGMIVGYDYDGAWTHRIPKTSENEYLIGVFVANSSKRLKDIVDRESKKNLTLEEYIRQGEKADHTSWTDRSIEGNNPLIIQKIQRSINKKISKLYQEKEKEISEKRNLGLSHSLANILLPKTTFGRESSIPTLPVPPNNSIGRGKKKSSMTIISGPCYNGRNITVEFEMYIRNSKCKLDLLVLTDYRRIDAESWENDEVEKQFPLNILSFKIDAIKKMKDKHDTQVQGLELSLENMFSKNDEIEIEMCRTHKFSTVSAISILSKEKCHLKGHITFTSADFEIKGAFDFKEDKDGASI